MFDDLPLVLAQAVWRRAIAASLLMGLVAVLSYSVDQAGWVAGVQWWPGAWLALLGAAALARARWRGGWAFAYIVLMLLAGAAELVGHVLPVLGAAGQTPGEWVWDLHLRSVALGLRLQGWGIAIVHGQPVRDTGLFVGLLALLVWGAVAWLAWWALRRRQALAASLPAAIILAANTHLSGQPWQLVLLFVILVLALAIYTTYASQNADWDRRRVDYPGDLGLDWGTAAIGLLLSIGLLGAAAPVVATPHGWHVLGSLFESSRQQVAATADQLFTGVKPPSGAIPVVVARTPDLSTIGNAVDTSQDTVMWVSLDEAAPTSYPGAPSPPQHYWRSGLYATYTGAGWQPVQLPAASAAPLPAVDQPRPGRYALRQQFQIVASHGQAQFAVNRPISATTGALLGQVATDDATALLGGPASDYAVTSFATRASQSELRAAGANYPADIRAAYLQMPAELPGRVGVLAAQIVGGANGAGDPYDQALRLQDYLRRTYAYRLDVPPLPAGHDAVDYFLYEAPGGFCSYYASAMAVMLRTLGVPARVATGYAMGDYDPARGAYRVPGAAAHAWVEVYFPGYGWVEFEPTPARAAFDRPVGATAFTATLPAPAAGLFTSASQPSRLAGVIAGASLLALALAAWAWWQLAERRRPVTPRGQALRLYAHIRSALSRAGLGAPPSVTADEYLHAQADALAARPPLLAAITEATALFRQAAYSPHPVTEAQTLSAQHRWGAARLSWLSLTLRRLVTK